MKIRTKRTYDEIEEEDEFRVLADRLWPRGIKKADAQIDYWAKEISPTTALRQSYHKEEITYEKFSSLYREELEANLESLPFIDRLKTHDTVTLLTSRKPIELSELPTLKAFIEKYK